MIRQPSVLDPKVKVVCDCAREGSLPCLASSWVRPIGLFGVEESPSPAYRSCIPGSPVFGSWFPSLSLLLTLTLLLFFLISRNCGNVFCSSCCNQKVPVPSQQLFEPSRVCKSCYSSLHPTSSSIDLELDKPIAATSN